MHGSVVKTFWISNGSALYGHIKILNIFVFQAIPETFSVRMIKDGGVFDENVTINVAEQTVTFYVPSQEGAVKANVVHDFRKVSFAFAVIEC